MRRVVPVLALLAGCGRIGFDPLADAASAHGAISNSRDFTCVVRAGEVWCWGENSAGQLGNDTVLKFVPTRVLGVPPATEVATGDSHTCAITEAGEVWCWGYNGYLQLGTTRSSGAAAFVAPSEYPKPEAVPLPGPALDISLGSNHTCAVIAGGAVWCWGLNDHGQLGLGTTDSSGDLPASVPGLDDATAVELGGNTSCVLHADAGASCWGEGSSGQLNNSSTADVTSPARIAGLSATSITAAPDHACARVDTNRVECWGANDYGQLGDGTTDPRPTRYRSTAAGFVRLAAGDGDTCAIDEIGRLTCWGRNDYSELGDGTTLSRLSPYIATVDLGGRPFAVAAGASGTCAIRDDSAVLCWGWGSRGQIGDGRGAMPTPQHVTTVPTPTAITVGLNHSCATNGSTVWCWGTNADGELGIGTQTSDPKTAPTMVVATWGSAVIDQLAAGDRHTCVLAGGNVYCWGYNGYGQVGDGTQQTRATPVQVALGQPVLQLGVESASTCARLQDRSVACWGANSSGQLGNGTMMDSNNPVAVTGLASVDDLRVGVDHACALTGASLACWGANQKGQLGIGSTSDTPTETPVAINNVTGLRAGGWTTCASTLAGTRCWGANDYGLIDTSLTGPLTTPTAVSRPLFEPGRYYSCELAAGCRGSSSYGQLGNGTFDTATTPLGFGAAGNAIALALGERHICGVFGTELYCWGDNDQGQLGLGTRSTAVTPALVTFP